LVDTVDLLQPMRRFKANIFCGEKKKKKTVLLLVGGEGGTKYLNKLMLLQQLALTQKLGQNTSIYNLVE